MSFRFSRRKGFSLAFVFAVSLLFASCEKTPDPELSIAQREYSIEAAGGDIIVSVSSNVTLSASPSAGWITLVAPAAGESGGTWRFSASRNDSYDSRSATIRFSSPSGGVSESVSITQAQQDAIIAGSLDYQLYYEAQTLSLPVSSNVGYSVSTSASWIKHTGTRGLSSRQLDFSVDENSSKETRTAVVTISSGSLRQTIQVEQLPTTRFPQTEEEINNSISTSYSIGNRIDEILDSLNAEGKMVGSELVKCFRNIDGVLTADLSSDGSTISVVQRDGIVINFIRNSSMESRPFGLANNTTFSTASSSIRSEYIASPLTRSGDSDYGLIINKGHKALIMAPFQHQFNTDLFALRDVLAPFFDHDPVILTNESADIFKFTGDYLSQYDFIFIYAHGGIGYRTINAFTNEINVISNSEKTFSNIDDVFILASSTKYTPQTAKYFIDEKLLSWNDIALCKLEKETNGKDNSLYFCMTPYYLNNASFNNSFVILNSCSSSKIWEGKGSLKEAFLNAGAAFYSGFSTTVTNVRAEFLAEHIFDFMAHGLSFQQAADYWSESEVLADNTSAQLSFYNDFEESWFQDNYKMSKKEYLEEARIGFTAPLKYGINPSLSNKQFHLTNPLPVLDIPVEKNGQMFFTWDCGLATFNEDVQYVEYNNGRFTRNEIVSCPQVVSFEVFVNGKKIEDSDPYDHSVYWTPVDKGTYTWYVVANVNLHEGKKLSYKSQEGTFTIKETPKTITLTTSEAKNITAFSALFQVDIEADWEPKIISRGVVYSSSRTEPEIRFSDCKQLSYSGTSSPLFVQMIGLTDGTTYYARSYVIVDSGQSTSVYYGNTVEFTTKVIAYVAEAVDLGLSVKWATCNLGAPSPEEKGVFFAWGETEPKDMFWWEGYKWCKGSENSLTKYCFQSEYGYNGFTDNKETLDLEDDAAYVKLGGKYRTPTESEYEELLENCRWIPVSDYNGTGVSGYVVQSNKQGFTNKQIFLPHSGRLLGPAIESCFYMTATVFSYRSNCFVCFRFNEETIREQYWPFLLVRRYEDSAIRPVCDK